MTLASTRTHMVVGAPQTTAASVCIPEWAQLFPASLSGSPRTLGESDPGSFQMTTTALGTRACEILWVPFKSGGSISQSPLALLKISPAGLSKSNILGVCLPTVGSPGCRFQCGTRTTCSLGKSPALVIILSFAGLPPRVQASVLTVSHLCPSCLSYCD